MFSGDDDCFRDDVNIDCEMEVEGGSKNKYLKLAIALEQAKRRLNIIMIIKINK